jgi:hypothetical protein
MCIYDIISLYYYQDEKYSRQICREYQDTRFIVNVSFFVENLAVYEINCKNMLNLNRPQMTI